MLVNWPMKNVCTLLEGLSSVASNLLIGLERRMTDRAGKLAGVPYAVTVTGVLVTF